MAKNNKYQHLVNRSPLEAFVDLKVAGGDLLEGPGRGVASSVNLYNQGELLGSRFCFKSFTATRMLQAFIYNLDSEFIRCSDTPWNMFVSFFKTTIIIQGPSKVIRGVQKKQAISEGPGTWSVWDVLQHMEFHSQAPGLQEGPR